MSEKILIEVERESSSGCVCPFNHEDECFLLDDKRCSAWDRDTIPVYCPLYINEVLVKLEPK